MAPPYKNRGVKNDKWWDDAYITHPDIAVEYQYVDGKDIVEPNDKIKFKRDRGTYKFRCLAHHILLDKRWIDCMDLETGEWRSFDVEKFKGKVKPRRRRRRTSEKV
jgi:hypothetical protein